MPIFTSEPFRTNVAALIVCEGRILACERADLPGSFQSVQGGVESSDADFEAALSREIEEELGVSHGEFSFVARSRFWRRYRFPSEVRQRPGKRSDVAGQEQLWFEVRLESLGAVRLEKSCGEFSRVELMTALEFVKSFVAWKRPVVSDFLLERGHLTLEDLSRLKESAAR